MMNAKPLFDAIRSIKGSPLTQAEVDQINRLLTGVSSPSSIDPVLFAAVADHLEAEEGRRKSAYQDSLGYWTIGIGRLIDARRGGGLSDAEINYLLANDVNKAIAQMQGWPSWERVKSDPARATALISMCFQLGATGLAGFKNSLAAIAQGAWTTAAASLRASLWAKQTPNRAKRVIAMIETGKL
jgi:lysozyme